MSDAHRHTGTHTQRDRYILTMNQRTNRHGQNKEKIYSMRNAKCKLQLAFEFDGNRGLNRPTEIQRLQPTCRITNFRFKIEHLNK